MDPLRFVRPDFDLLDAYTPVKPLDVLAAEIGVPVGELVKLDANENLYGPIPEVREAIANADLHIYPDPSQTALRAAIAGYTNVTPAQVVAGQGADELIDIALRLFTPKVVIDNVPSFGMYGFLAKINGAEVVEVKRGDGFSVNLKENEHAVRWQGATMVFVTSPNNPTGNQLAPAELEALLKLNAMVVLDEAYVEFAGGAMTEFLRFAPNLIILRTFSKWAALAGLRVGYALCHPAVAERMMAIKQPYNVSVAADVAARAAIKHRAVIGETLAAIVAERERMARLIGELGWLKPLPSQANFILCEVHGGSARTLTAALRQQGILVRYYANPLLENYIRISAARPEDTDRLMAALRELGPDR